MSQGERLEAIHQRPHNADTKAYVIMLTLMVILVYFCILREENDIDDFLKMDLYDHFGPEASRLKKAYDYNMKNRLPVTEIVRRLQEIGAPVPPPPWRK